MLAWPTPRFISSTRENLPSLLTFISPAFSFYCQVLELEGVIEGIERTASADQQMELELARVINEVNCQMICLTFSE